MKSYLQKNFRICSSESSKLQIYGGWCPPSATRCLVYLILKIKEGKKTIPPPKPPD